MDREQSYDNARNMLWIQVLQLRIKDVNPLAEYVPCSAHYLHLVGSRVAEYCVNAIPFFGINKLLNFSQLQLIGGVFLNQQFMESSSSRY